MAIRCLVPRCAWTATAALLIGGFACSSDPKPSPQQDASVPPPPVPDAPIQAPAGLTDEQFARLEQAFPGGVCDYSKPGVGQQPAESPLDFSAGAGGLPLATLPPPAQSGLRIVALSNRPDMISGGDVLTEILVPEGAKLDKLKVLVDGSDDVTAGFARRANGRVLGVLDQLRDGTNLVTVDLGDGHPAALTINNHNAGGPVISGPQITPWVCATPVAKPEKDGAPATNASGLPTEAFDSKCNIESEIKLWYHSTAEGCVNALPDPSPPTPKPTSSCFKEYDPAKPPSDLAMTTTDQGKTVPYIVRVERGTLNRGIYDIAVLFDPSLNGPAAGWDPFVPHAGWNGKVVYTFGASTGVPRQQFRSSQSWTDDAALSRGFMVALNSMTDSLFNANRVTMSETVMMMKEKIIDTYGEIRSMVGNGCSGGSINQLTTASIFPGLLDGIQPTCTYPDSETTGIEVADCTLLVTFYASEAWRQLTAGLTQAQINAKKAAINGHVDQTGCHAWVNLFSNLGRPGNYIPTVVLDNVTGAIGPDPRFPTPINNCRLPSGMVYDPVSKRDGVRCTTADHAASIVGKVDGHGRDTRDNVGVQYGLKAFLAGAITAEEFVTLNEKIGGVDADNNFSTERTAGDSQALATVYRAGIVSDGAQLAKTPMVDLRGYDDSNLAPPGAFGIHHVWRSFSLRARLDAANGNHANHVMWRFGTGLLPPPQSNLIQQSFDLIDQWVTDIKADTSDNAIEKKILDHRPASAFDFCYLGTDFTNKVRDFTACEADARLKPLASPRQVAGGPLAENVLKCQLRPLDRNDYVGAGY